jgi:hypothetical protein
MELLASVDAPALAAQPFAVEKPGASKLERIPAVVEQLERLSIA